MNLRTQKNNPLFPLIFGVTLFFAAVGFVQAQGFIEPSDQAPNNNVVDFISESGQAQARYGKLRIGSDVIPNQAADPIVDVIGNTYIQGNAYFDRQAIPAWQVILSQAPRHINAGTTVTNGKLTIQSTAGPALYANSTLSDAIYVKTLSDNTKAVFGQTIQVSGGSVSSGVRGDTIDAAGAGIFAQQQNCPGTDISVCGSAAQFVGNVVVTGVIRGDGRGIVRTWTMNDASSPSKGISVKTFDVPDTELAAGTPRTWSKTGADVLPEKATFISMSVMVNGSPYDPIRATVNSTLASYLHVTYDTTTRTLSVRKGNDTEDLVILMYYHQEISATIVDQDGNVLDPARAMAGSSSPMTFRGAIGGGEFEGGEFLWTLHTDQSATNANKCAGICGTVAESGSSTTYIPPADIPATTPANTVWLKATWTADPAIYSVQQIDLYKITWTLTPKSTGQTGYVPIGNQNFTFKAQTSCPAGECTTNPIAWSQQSSIGSESVALVPATGDGLYTSPTTIDSGSSWTSVVRAAIALHPELYVETSFPLLPQISITASVGGTTISSGGIASIGISQTVTLNATALGIPPPLVNDFNWTLQEFPAVFGESLTGGSAAGQTDNVTPNITYTAPNSVQMGGRVVTATWRSAGSSTIAHQTIRIYEGNANNVTFAQTENTTGTKSLVVSGFASERRIYSFCTTLDCTNEQVVDYVALAAGTPYTIGGGLTGNCGTLRLTGPATSNTTCNPNIQTCTLTSTFSFSATGTGLCTLRAKLMGDQRATTVITLDPVGAGCTCNPKTGYCCIINGGTTTTEGGATSF